MTENPLAGRGAVVLDIGDDIGAIVVSAPAELAGAELEICPAGRRGERPDDGNGWWSGEWRSHGHAHEHGPAWPHVAVLARPGTPRCAAVFPGVREGRYEAWRRPAEPTAFVVTVSGGAVTNVSWP